MWFARLWTFIALSGAGLLLGGALTALPGTADEAANAARHVAASRTADLLTARISAMLSARRADARLAARHPALASLRTALTGELPEHVRASITKQHLGRITRDHPRPTWILFDPQAAIIGSSRAGDVDATLGGSAPIKQALTGQLAVGQHGEHWVVAVPLDGAPRWVIAALSPTPTSTLRSLHRDLDDTTQMVIYQRNAAVDARPEDAPLQTITDTLEGQRSAAVQLGGTPHHAQRFTVPAAPGLSFALAWPTQPASHWSTVGLGALWNSALTFEPITRYTLGGAAAAWLIGLLLALGLRRRTVQQAARHVALLGGDPNTRVRSPGWLQPMVQAAEDALADAKVQHPPAHAPAETSAEISAEHSAEASAERSAEASAERSAEASAETSAEQSSAEQSSEAPAEVSAEASGAGEHSGGELLDGPPTVIRTGPPRRTTPPAPPAAEASSSTSRPVTPIGGSLFEMPVVRAMDADDEDLESDDVLSDADIRLPGTTPPAPSGGLLAQIERQSALEPERRSVAPQDLSPRPAAPAERTQITPMPANLLAINQAEEVEAEASEDAYFRTVFDQFVQIKTQCGERTESLEFTRFRTKLLRTRSALMDRFDCHDVRFRVYVKDGKAALRAAPVLESSVPRSSRS